MMTNDGAEKFGYELMNSWGGAGTNTQPTNMEGGFLAFVFKSYVVMSRWINVLELWRGRVDRGRHISAFRPFQT